MINIRQALLICLINIIGTLSYSQEKKPILSAPENWVKTISPELNAKIDEKETDGGVAYLLVDIQENIAKQSTFCHYTYKILNSNGSQNMSDIEVSFDPTFQKVYFHSLVIYRNGTRIDILKTHDFQTFRRETDRERYLYDGTVTSIINIKDVREGDIIEYSYTYKGYNPLMKGKFSSKQWLNYSMPIYHQYYSITTPADRTLKFYYNKPKTPKPKEYMLGKDKVYEWDTKNIRPILSDNFIPAWYTPYQQVFISEYNNWAEIVDWALPLYEIKNNDLSKIKSLYGEEIDSNDYASITKAIRFVQDEIRYLGFEAGMGSYKPNRPEQVFNNRFGDCKDKSLLLVALLRSAGIRAYPMLVNTTLTSELINQEVSSPNSFDHCVVNISLDGDEYYIDPTLNYQGNILGEIHFPNYHYGLVIKKGEDALRKIEASRIPTVFINEVFRLRSFGGAAEYKVVTEYDNAQADYQRAMFKNSSIENISKSYIDFYGKLYPKIKVKEKLNYYDQYRDESNIFMVTEKYNIENIWSKNTEDTALLYIEFFPLIIHSYLTHLTSSERTTPYALPERVRIVQQTKVFLPQPLIIEPKDFYVDHPSFSFSFSALGSIDNKSIMLKYEYIVNQEYVRENEFTDFYNKQNQLRNNLSYFLTIDTSNIGNDFHPQLYLILFGLVALIIFIYLAIRVHVSYNPIPDRSYTPYNAIGGWLILVAIGVSLSPFLIGYDIFFGDTFFNNDVWVGKTEKKLTSLVIVGLFLALEIANLILSILVAIHFFQRRSSLPKLIIILFVYRIILSFLSLMVALYYGVDQSENLSAFIRTLIPSAIWIPYFYLSKRVYGTFTRRYNDDEYEIYGNSLTNSENTSEHPAPGND